MACSDDGKCPSAFESLCAYVGNICINIETVIGGLIRNQKVLIDSLFANLGTAFPTCTAVYFNPTTCTFTDVHVAGEDYYVGTQIGTLVYSQGRVTCITFEDEGAGLPACGDRVRDHILLEDATVDGCAQALLAPCDYYSLENNTTAQVIPAGVNVQVGVDRVIPHDGTYLLNWGWNTSSTFVPTSTHTAFYVIRNGVQLLVQRSLMEQSQGIANITRGSFTICLSEGDIINWGVSSATEEMVLGSSSLHITCLRSECF